MAKNEVGEFELVLGNRQLLSVFFIVVVLLGVFFTMGYIVGRNSGSTAPLEARKLEGKPPIIESPGAPPPSQVATATEASGPQREASAPPLVVESKPVESADDAKAARERKAEEKKAEEKKAAERKKEEAAREKADKEKAGKEAKAEEKKPRKSEAAAPSSGPLSGTYLQLAAVPRSEADLLISVLNKKGFSAAAGPGPEGSNLFRVLVGPLSGADSISKTRTDLNDAGMQGTKAIIRKF